MYASRTKNQSELIPAVVHIEHSGLSQELATAQSWFSLTRQWA